MSTKCRVCGKSPCPIFSLPPSQEEPLANGYACSPEHANESRSLWNDVHGAWALHGIGNPVKFWRRFPLAAGQNSFDKKPPRKRLLVTGPLTDIDWETFRAKLDKLTEKMGDVIVVVGGEKGVGKLAERWAFENSMAMEIHHLNTDGFGARAKEKQIEFMVGVADYAAVWDDGKSKRLAAVLKALKDKGTPTKVVPI